MLPEINLLQASVYGKCIAADFNGVYKDKCLTEFMKLKDCYTVMHINLLFMNPWLNLLEGCCKTEMKTYLQ